MQRVRSRRTQKPGVIDADWLRELCLAAGADDVAFAGVDNPDLASELEHVQGALPGTKSYISPVVKMNRDNVRSTARSFANQEFHRSGELLNEAAHRIVRRLDYSPCLECKLCAAACPVGAIGKNGEFDFVACSVHNYREFMGGFTDWVQTIADSADAADFRSRVSDSENASMWQSLSFKPNYKAAYCLAVCPAGEEVIEPYLHDRKGFIGLGAETVAGQEGDALRVAELAGQGARRTPLSAQAGEGRRRRNPRAVGRHGRPGDLCHQHALQRCRRLVGRVGSRGRGCGGGAASGAVVPFGGETVVDFAPAAVLRRREFGPPRG